MPDAGPAMPWLDAWLKVQQQLSQFATDPSRRLLEFGNDYAGMAAEFWSRMPTQTREADLAGLQAALVERYRGLFMPVVWPAPAAGSTGTPYIRCQQAVERFNRQATAIAIDASARLCAALSATGPEAPPIASLRELHALWIECGEAAYAAQAHREEFADAQAELLAAFVELRAGQGRR
jgi:poly(hydroxyalkanoate) synthase III subunit E